MLFSSLTFLFYFLPVFLLLYYLLPKKNLVFLLGSLLFYFWGEKEYIYVLFFSIAFNYSFGILIEKFIESKFKHYIIFLGMFFNLSLLIYYKYFLFIMENLLYIDASVIDEQSIHIHLPLGISFFTFQGISYLIDVYRQEVKSERNFINLALYIAMFPPIGCWANRSVQDYFGCFY